MANELFTPHPPGAVLYAVVTDGAGRNWDGAAFVTPAAAGWASSDIAMADPGATGQYVGDFPAVAAGLYRVVVYRRAGAAPAVGDPVVAAGAMNWDGTAEVVPGGGGGTAELDEYARAYLYGDIHEGVDGSIDIRDADLPGTPRLRFDRRSATGGRIVVKDPAS